MKETLIQYDTAVLAKEKGFELDFCFEAYATKDLFHNDDPSYSKGNVIDLILEQESFIGEYKDLHYAQIVSQSLLQRWLREEHKLHIEIELIDTVSEYYFECLIKNSKDREDVFGVSVPVETYLLGKYQTYEQALEAGLQEALKLI